MQALFSRTSTAIFGAALLTLGATGCATKKHVRKTVGPVEARVSQAERRNAEQQSAIGELNNSVSRADERAMDAERKARAAGEAAQVAHNRADVAHGRADSAHHVAEETRSRMGQIVENIDNYRMVTSENVLFGLGKHTLTKEAKQQLDNAVAQLKGTKNFVLEVQGFTDATGSAASNLELSRKRADAVVRYLTVTHNVPLRKISVLGIGEDDPNADNKTREGRKQARRVEMRVFSLDLGGEQSASSAPGPQSMSTQQPAAGAQSVAGSQSAEGNNAAGSQTRSRQDESTTDMPRLTEGAVGRDAQTIHHNGQTTTTDRQQHGK